MNIYNFIYCFFYKLWEKRGSDGRLNGTAHVLFALFMHLLLITELFLRTTGYNLIHLPNYVTYGNNKTAFFLYTIPFSFAIWLFYNKKRTERLLEEYEDEYGDDESRITLRILIFVVIAPVLLIFLAVMRQQGFW